MGKTGRWFRSFLGGSKDKGQEKNEDGLFAQPGENCSSPLPRTVPKEKKRWSFRRSAGRKKESTYDPSENGEANMARGSMVASTMHAIEATLPVDHVLEGRKAAQYNLEEFASIKIQAAFRAHLARKALRALKGLVKIQAMVRGYLLRKQTSDTLRCMEALVTIQARAQAKRAYLAEEAQGSPRNQAPPRRYPSLKSPCTHPAYSQENFRTTDGNMKTIEIDWKATEIASNPQTYCSIVQNCKHQKSRLQGNMRTENMHPISPPSSAASTYMIDFDLQQQDFHYTSNDTAFCPNYMANTESSRAKARSQSAPRQRSEGFERQLSRRRPSSVERRNIPRCVHMQRSSSQSLKDFQPPWSIRFDNSMSLKDSECGSTSTILTSANY